MRSIWSTWSAGARRRAGSIETLQNLQLPGKNGQSVPLAAVATFHYELEQPVIWRRSRPTITIRGSIVDATQPATIAQQLEPKVQEFVRALPAGYRVAVGGPVEESAKSQGRSRRWSRSCCSSWRRS